MEDPSTYLKHASKKDVEEKLEEGERAKKAVARLNRTKKELAIASGGMAAEAGGALLGGAIVGYMAANDHEEWITIGAAMLGTAAGMMRLQEPGSMAYQVAFATAVGMGAAVASTYSRDYFSGGQNQPVT